MKTSTFALSALALALPCSLATAARAVEPTLAPTTTGYERSDLTWADFDGDGLEDAAAIDADGALRVLHNSGDGSLREVTLESGLSGVAARFLVWGDADGDGRLELLVGTPAGASRLLRYDAGTFVDVAASLGIDHQGADLSARWLDYDQDGRVDLSVVTADGHVLYHAQDTGFERVDLTLDTGLVPFVHPFVSGVLSPAASAADAALDTDLAGRTSVRHRAGGSAGFGPAGPGSTGGGTSALGGPVSALCLPQIADNAGGACIRASRVPTTGMLLPLGEYLDFNLANNGEALFGLPGIAGGVRIGTPGGWPGVLGLTNDGGGTHSISFENAGININPNGGPSEFWVGENGNVGIGTLNPAMKLDIVGGDMRLRQDVDNADVTFLSSADVNLTLAADINNSGEADQPTFIMSQDGGLEEVRMGFFDATNDFQLRKLNPDDTIGNALRMTSSFTRFESGTATDGRVDIDPVGPGGRYPSVHTTRSDGTSHWYTGEVGIGGSSDSYGSWVSDAQSLGRAGAYYDATNDEGVIFANVKNFREPNPRNPETDIVYASLEGPEAAAYARGTGSLVDGMATIRLPQHFSDVSVAEGMTVHLTPGSAASMGLAVVERSATAFVVRELHAGTGSYSFDWEVKAVRRGYEDYEVVRPRLLATAAPTSTGAGAQEN